MLTTTLTSAIGTTMAHASQAPNSVRTMSTMPRPPDRMPTREAESSVMTTIGTMSRATHSRSNPNQAPASRRVATAPAPIIPAAVSAAGPTSRANIEAIDTRGAAALVAGTVAAVEVIA